MEGQLKISRKAVKYIPQHKNALIKEKGESVIVNQGVGQSVGQGPGADYSQLEAALDHGDDYRQLLQCNHPLINLSNDGRVIRLFAS